MDPAGFVRRLLPALLMASSVTLLTAGIFNFAPPAGTGALAEATATSDTGNPVFDITPRPSRTAPPTVSASPPASSLPASPTPRPTPTASPLPDAPPTRVVVPSLGIDLPVIEGVTGYPLCDVAQYLDGFANPGQPGTTYIYAHARTGMFLPLLDESKINDGAGMIGALVKLYTADSRLHLYQITIVKRHATDLTLAYDLAPGEQRLILQTSEGPHGTVPKLQVAATPIGTYAATPAEALPMPQPTDCAP
jgi:hypothetical protein